MRNQLDKRLLTETCIDDVFCRMEIPMVCRGERSRINNKPCNITRVRFKEEASITSLILATSKEPLAAGREIINGLQKIGLKAKPFCLHKPKNGEKSFIVQGENFKWIIVPIAHYQKPEEIPSEMFKRLAVLKEHRIKYDGIAIAFPMKGKAVEKIDGELKAMADSFSSLAGTIGCLAALPFTIIAEISDELKKDPVLLVRFGSFKDYDLHIELGRWE